MNERRWHIRCFFLARIDLHVCQNFDFLKKNRSCSHTMSKGIFGTLTHGKEPKNFVWEEKTFEVTFDFET